MLHKMEMSGSTKDQNLLSVLREVPNNKQEKEATQFSTETPTDEYDDGETYDDTDGSKDVSLKKNEMNGCDYDVNQTVEGSDVNL